MTMDAGQVVREYRAARDPWRSIGILAQLNACGRERIFSILRGAGIDPQAEREAARAAAAMSVDVDVTRIKEMRLARGWTRKQLAAAVGVTPQAVENWERGRNTPTAERKAKLAAVFEEEEK